MSDADRETPAALMARTLREMADRVDRNADDAIGGCAVIVATGRDPLTLLVLGDVPAVEFCAQVGIKIKQLGEPSQGGYVDTKWGR